MAITAYTGRPGAGKSYAMVEQVIVANVAAGRRVLTNIEGVQPDKVVSHCILEGSDPDKVGSVVLFDGSQAKNPGFFPTEEIPDDETFVKGGDLIVFDEWRLTWPNSGKLPNADLEPFLRWHRHLTNADGVACDVVIGTQLITDIHRNFRGLVHRSYKFKKLDAANMSKAFAWHVYEGHLQPKGEHYAVGNGRYRPEIFALYKSYSGDAKGNEKSTDARGALLNRWTIGFALLSLALIAWGIWYALRWFSAPGEAVAARGATPPRAAAVSNLPPPPPAKSPYRIVGHVIGDDGVRVLVATDSGGVRMLPPDNFRFASDGRPTSGFVDGVQVVAEDRFVVGQQAPTTGVFGL